MFLPGICLKNLRKRFGWMALAVPAFLGLLLPFALARADGPLQNGSFAAGLSGWTVSGSPAARWEAGGYDGVIAHNGERLVGQGGYLRLETDSGAGQSVPGCVYQDFTVPAAGSRVTLSLAWAKAARGEMPARQVATVRIFSPGGLAWEWRDSTAASVYGEVYGLDWNLLEDQNYIADAAGTYQFELGADLQSGDAADALTAVAFDEVHLSVTVPDRTPPVAPSGLAVADPRTGGSLRLNWSANDEADLAGYAIYRAEAKTGPFQRVPAGLVAANSFLDSGLTDGTTYYYYITALDDSGNESSPSSLVEGIPSYDTTPPAAPAGFRIWDAATGNRLELSWAANREEDLAGYLLYRAEKEAGPFTLLFGEPVLDNSYVDTAVENDVVYYYYLVAMDMVGNASPPTAAKRARPTLDTTPPDVPSGFRVENPGTGTELDLYWQPNDEPDLEGYYVYRQGPAGGGWERIAMLCPEEGGAYTDPGVQRGETYRYRLAAFDRVGNVSEPTAEWAAAAADFTPPASPVGLDLQDPWSGSELQVNWTANQEADLAGYNLYRGATPDDPGEKLNEQLLAGTSYMDRGLKQGRLYYYRVTAVDTTGNESDPSAPAAGKPYLGTAVSALNLQGEIPAGLRLEQTSSAIFLAGELTSVEFRAVAEDVYGRKVPVSGVWWFATDQSRFELVRLEGEQGARAVLSGEPPGIASVIVEFVPQQAGAVPVRAEAAVRVLDWRVELSVSSHATVTGSKENILTARVSDASGAPVNNPGALVAFAVERVEKPGRRAGQDRIGRFTDAGHALTLGRNGLALATPGRPDAGGLVRSVLSASTAPGRNRVRAVLSYQDSLRAQGPTLVASSDNADIAVQPGPAAYVGWLPAETAVRAGREYTASLHAFDAFGNITEKVDGIQVSIQSPAWGKVDYSLDGGKTWLTDDQWHPAGLGSAVKVRVPGDNFARTGHYAYLPVRIDKEGGAALAPPPGVGQVNRPLVLRVE